MVIQIMNLVAHISSTILQTFEYRHSVVEIIFLQVPDRTSDSVITLSDILFLSEIETLETLEKGKKYV